MKHCCGCFLRVCRICGVLLYSFSEFILKYGNDGDGIKNWRSL